MNTRQASALHIWIVPGAVWLALLLLLALTVGSAYVPLGIFNSILNLTIAAIKVLLVLLFFMKLRSSSPLLRLAAMAGLFWLAFMFVLTAGDYLTRQ
ncbi:MAG TPA: cytochrome C oxidase subunit IV family protein [Pseudolabrys sp.]|nr:cytochrome C oxidase subunit IV family protein [Pseudolabrys sp.]